MTETDFFIIGQFAAAPVAGLGEVLLGFNRQVRFRRDVGPCEPKVVFAVPMAARVSWQSFSVPTKSEGDNVNNHDHDTRRPCSGARILRP